MASEGTLSTEADDAVLAASSQFFDAAWYLARNHDVARAGVDPVLHFLRFGGAEGRDPSPNFNTKWYSAQNPDVLKTGMNPLIHYLRLGAAQGREPNPLAMFRRNIMESPERIDRLLRQFVEPLQDRPEKAHAGNWHELSSEWARYFLANGVAAYKGGQLADSLNHFKSAIQVCPGQIDSWALYGHVFREYNWDAINQFESSYADTKLIILHISCKPNVQLAERSCSSFNEPNFELRNLTVIADDTLAENKFTFNKERQLLIVPSNDRYEGLTFKVVKSFLFLGFSRVSIPVLKIDDDIVCGSTNSLRMDFSQFISKHDYGGFVIGLPTPFAGCRVWHFGKCTNPKINHRPDTNYFISPYAAGPSYWLGVPAIRLLSKLAIIHEEYFELGHGYEDRAVGTSLGHYGINPVFRDLIASGSLQRSAPVGFGP